jgi:hypothetical protein
MSVKYDKIKSNKTIIKYDPTKILNKKGLLNEAAIKCRYDLMYINDYYRMEGEKIKDYNIFIRNRSEYDRDIINFKKMIVFDSNDEFMFRAGYIKNKILKSKILEKLDNLDHNQISKTREILMKSKKEFTGRLTSAEKSYDPYKDYKLKERREISNRNKLRASLIKPRPEKSKILITPNRNNSYDSDKSIGSLNYMPTNQTKNSKKSNSVNRRMINYGKVPKPRRKSRILKENSIADHIDGYQNINSRNYMDILNNMNMEVLNPSLPDINSDSKTSKKEEFTNVSLEGDKVYLIKNYLYTNQEKQSRLHKVASLNSVLINSQIRNVLRKKTSKKLVHEILTGPSVQSNSMNNVGLNTGNSLNTLIENTANNFNNLDNNSYSVFDVSNSEFNKLQLMTYDDTASQNFTNSNCNSNQLGKRSSTKIKMNGRDILKKIYTGAPMTNTEESGKKSEKIFSTFKYRNTLARPNKLPNYLIQSKNKITAANTNTLNTEPYSNLQTDPSVPYLPTNNSKNDKVSLTTEHKKKKRITFDQINNNKSNAMLTGHYKHLNTLTNKIDDEFKNFNKMIGGVLYTRAEDDLYYNPQSKFVNEDITHIDIKKFFKRNLTFDLEF